MEGAGLTLDHRLQLVVFSPHRRLASSSLRLSSSQQVLLEHELWSGQCLRHGGRAALASPRAGFRPGLTGKPESAPGGARLRRARGRSPSAEAGAPRALPSRRLQARAREQVHTHARPSLPQGDTADALFGTFFLLTIYSNISTSFLP